MNPKDDHPAKGLWSNLKHGKEVGGFTWSEIADQMSFYTPGGNRKRLTRALERIVLDHQLTSRYVPALALAWGITEVMLLHHHFDSYPTREALKEQTGFDADAIVVRWHQNREARERVSRQMRLTLSYGKTDDGLITISGSFEPDSKDKSAGS
jgi:hypothetical protein